MKIAVLGPKGTFSEKCALEYIKKNNLANKNIVLIFPDSLERYLSE